MIGLEVSVGDKGTPIYGISGVGQPAVVKIDSQLQASRTEVGQLAGIGVRSVFIVVTIPVTTETIDLGRKTLSRVREVGSVLYLNKQNASFTRYCLN